MTKLCGLQVSLKEVKNLHMGKMLIVAGKNQNLKCNILNLND
mgnify:CR=1 FL=1